MEPLVFRDNGKFVVQKGGYASSRGYGWDATSGHGHLDRSDCGHVDTSTEHEPSSGRPNSDGDASAEGSEHRQGHQLRQLPYDHHSVHLVTQYYVPEDPRRAREV